MSMMYHLLMHHFMTYKILMLIVMIKTMQSLILRMKIYLQSTYMVSLLEIKKVRFFARR